MRLELKPNFALPDNIVAVTFKNHGLFTRFVSDIDTLAELNKWADAIDVADIENVKDAEEEATAKRLASIVKNQKPLKPGVPEKSEPIVTTATDVAVAPKK